MAETISFKTWFENLKKRKEVFVIYIFIATGLNLLLLYTGQCFATLLIALSTFGVPYLFGLRSIKRHLIFGTVILLLTTLFGAVIATYYVYSYYGAYDVITVQNDRRYLIENSGYLSPLSGDGKNTVYTFGINHSFVSYTPPVVFVNITDDINSYNGVDIYHLPSNFIWYNVTNNTDLKSRNWTDYDERNSGHHWYILLNCTFDNSTDPPQWSYQYKCKLPEGNFYYYFSALTVTKSGNQTTYAWRNTQVKHGPVNMERTTMLGLMSFYYLILIFAGVGIVYYLLVSLFWWLRKAKKEREKWAKELEKEKWKVQKKKKMRVEFTCSKCGAVVGDDDKKCPKCGESFEDEEKVAAPRCNVCFGTIKSGMVKIVCNCGKRYHLSCAKRTGECPNCKKKLKTEDKKSKW